MNRLDDLFAKTRASGRTAFVPFLTAGDPDLQTTRRLVMAIARQAQALDVPLAVELGFPYSDPIADGATIQASYTRALAKGVRQEAIFTMVSQLRQELDTPLVAMASFSLAHRLGVEAWLARAAAAGLDGAILPDLPPEEASGTETLASKHGVKLIHLVAPTTPPARLDLALRQSGGFVYVVSVVGITGARMELPAELPGRLADLRQRTKLPLCVGFGISQPEQVAKLKGQADGVIVGSALVKLLAEAGTTAGEQRVADMAATLMAPLRPA